MKPGSIVVCTPTPYYVGQKLLTNAGIPAEIVWLPVPDEKTQYMVNNVFEDLKGIIGVEVIEGVIGYTCTNPVSALGLPAKYYREILPPMEIASLLTEKVKEPQLV